MAPACEPERQFSEENRRVVAFFRPIKSEDLIGYWNGSDLRAGDVHFLRKMDGLWRFFAAHVAEKTMKLFWGCAPTLRGLCESIGATTPIDSLGSQNVGADGAFYGGAQGGHAHAGGSFFARDHDDSRG